MRFRLIVALLVLSLLGGCAAPALFSDSIQSNEFASYKVQGTELPARFRAAIPSFALPPSIQRDVKDIRILLPSKKGNRVKLNLFPDAQYIARITNSEPSAGGLKSVTGMIRGARAGRAQLSVTGEQVRGTVYADGRTFEIIPLAERWHLILEVDAKSLPGEAKALLGAAPSDPLPRPKREGEQELRVLLVFPEGLQGYCSDSHALNGYRLQLSDALQTAGATMNVTVSSLCLETYTATEGDLIADLEWLAQSREVRSKRIAENADLVSLTVPNGDYCGRAYENALPLSSAARDRAFSVVRANCVSTLSFVHEVGHNLGMRHDRFSEGGGIDSECNYGFVNPRKLERTIMALNDACSDQFRFCGRWPEFSDPGSRGEKCSVRLTGLGGSANNAEVARASAPVARDFLP